ncbi:hypothetical protein DFJ63DRAFT_38932 [Scheffersomyces coipomensis]|uniref:uncharacterized protein n=1 Tax=Scheffersomyces coipomensis TaxID=1788519 RepID=UPI00315D0E1D
MSSRSWAINAVKKSKTQLVPGSSKWLSKEMSAHYENVLTNSESHFHDFQSYQDDLNSFMKKVMQLNDDEEKLNDFISDRISRNTSTFSPIRQKKEEQDQTMESINEDNLAAEEEEKEMEKVVEDISNLEVQTTVSKTTIPVVDTEPTIEDGGADDSFQAISKAIRKSIADKTALGNTFFKPESQLSSEDENKKEEIIPESINKSYTSRKSAITPKRSSLFVSLPAREPITVTATSKRKSVGRSKNGSSRVYDRLDVESRMETASIVQNEPVEISAKANDKQLTETETLDYNFSMSPVKIPLSKRPFAAGSSKEETTEIDIKSDILSKSESNQLKSSHHDAVKSSIPQITASSKEITQHSKTLLSESKIPRLSHHEKIKVETNVQEITSPEGSSTPISSRLTSRNSPTSIGTSKTSRSKSPEFKSPISVPSRAISRSRSISPYRSKSSRSPTTSLERYSSSPVKEEEMNLINRLSAPTSSSAAKYRSSIATKNSELKKAEPVNTKNRFLTTTLNSSNPQFKLQKPPQSNRRLPLSHAPSPVKSGLSNLDDGSIPKLDSGSIPSLKKKSLMAERSEAAASKPRQKILISVNHTAKIASLKSDTQPKEKLDSVEPKSAKRVNEKASARRDIGNAVALPDAARGYNIKPTDSSKRRKLLREEKTPSRVTSNKKQTYDSKSSASERRTTFKSMPILYPQSNPSTPRRKTYTAETLPDILTDEEDNSSNKSKKILQSWGSTPELRRIVLQNKEINPATVFGEVPKLVIEDIFDTQASILRGKQSPDMSPDEKQRRKEEREYAIEMGYK